jgi:RimJ/RimL family protein N-acetyltransferase
VDPVEIAAEGLLLRPWRPDDADAVHRACQDPDIRRWTTVPSPYLREHADTFVGKLAPEAWATGTGAPFAVCDATTGGLLGSCGLIRLDRTGGTGEIGYWTAPWARGRGVAVVATRAVARWAFDDLGVRRAVLRIETGNHGSLLTALRAGCVVEGIARDGVAPGRDAWVGAILAGDDDPQEPPPYVRRRAKVFGQAQPTLFATTKSGEIRLRPLEERDIDGVIAGARDPASVRWTTVPHPYEREHAEFFVHDYGPRVWARGTGALFGIGDPVDDAYGGVMELRLWERDPAVADVGFVVPPHARGRGYAPAALAAVAAWGFTALGLIRVEWRANVGNTASRRVAEKAGFAFEGTTQAALDHRGERVDAWVAALLATDIGKGDT